MDIRMTTVAFALNFCKFKGGMAQFAGNRLVLTHQGKFGFIVIEGYSLQIYFPTICFMTIITIGSKAISVRRFLGQQIDCKYQENYYR
jgi:hypothetical protein